MTLCSRLEMFQVPTFDPQTLCVFFLTVITVVDAVMDDNETLDFPQTLRWINFAICTTRVMVANIFL